ncbi:hypothetical protein AAMO2058_001346400 [Amorphochlora amoebiformis]
MQLLAIVVILWTPQRPRYVFVCSKHSERRMFNQVRVLLALLGFSCFTGHAAIYKLSAFHEKVTPTLSFGVEFHNIVEFAVWLANNDMYPTSIYGSAGIPTTAFGSPNETIIVESLDRDIDDPLMTYHSLAVQTGACEDMPPNCTKSMAFIGPATNNNLRDVQSYASDQRILQVSPWSFSRIVELHVTSTMFKCVPDVRREAIDIVRFVKAMGWTHASVIANFNDLDAVFFLKGAISEAKEIGISIPKQGGYVPTTDGNGNIIVEASDLLNGIKQTGYHIIIMYSRDETEALALLRQAKSLGLLGNGFVWLGNENWASGYKTEQSGDLAMFDLLDGVLSIKMSPPQLPPVAPCSKLGEKFLNESTNERNETIAASKRKQGIDLRNANSEECIYEIWKIAHTSQGFPIAPPLPTISYRIFVAFDSAFSVIYAMSKLAEAVNECKTSANTVSNKTCKNLQTLTGQREFVLEYYNVSDYYGFGGSMKPNDEYQVTRNGWIVNTRRELFIEKRNNPHNSTVSARRATGVILSENGRFLQYPDVDIFYYGGTTEKPSNRVGSPLNQQQHIEVWAVNVGYFILVLMTLVSILAIVWMFFNLRYPVVRASQPVLMVQIACGTIFSSFAIFFAGMDDRYYSEETLTSSCNMVIWSYGVGFALTCSAVMTKTWHAKTTLLGAYKTLKAIRTSSIKLVGLSASGVGIECIIITVWMSLYGFEWRRKCEERDMIGNCVKSRGYCHTENLSSLSIPVILYHLLCMISALYMCYLARLLPETFAEIRWITTAMVSNLQILVIGIFLLYNLRDQPTNFYLVKSVCVFLGDGSIVLFLFLPRMFNAYFQGGSDDHTTEHALNKLAAKVKADNNRAMLRSQLEKKSRGSSNVVTSKRPSCVKSDGLECLKSNADKTLNMTKTINHTRQITKKIQLNESVIFPRRSSVHAPELKAVKSPSFKTSSSKSVQYSSSCFSGS